MMAQETILKCREIYVEMSEVEKEKEMHDSRSKACKKRIEGMESEIRELVNCIEHPQGNLFEGPAPPPDISEFTCSNGEGHTWLGLRDNEERTLESCETCGAERTYDKTNPTEGWVYVLPKPKEEEAPVADDAVATATTESEVPTFH